MNWQEEKRRWKKKGRLINDSIVGKTLPYCRLLIIKLGKNDGNKITTFWQASPYNYF